MGKYMQHKEFRAEIKAKLRELEDRYGSAEIYKTSRALRKGPARDEFIAWYLRTRRQHISGHQKQMPDEYYVRMGLANARMARREMDGETGTNRAA